MRDADDLPGGPAFPISLPGMGDGESPGMALRDWFAGMALSHILSNRTYDAPAVARAAYTLADELLKARNRSPT